MLSLSGAHREAAAESSARREITFFADPELPGRFGLPERI
jgi:hypothetical protein